MKKIIRLTESDLTRLIKRVIVEMETPPSISVNKDGKIVIDSIKWQLQAYGAFMWWNVKVLSLTKQSNGNYKMEYVHPSNKKQLESIIKKDKVDLIMKEINRSKEIDLGKTDGGNDIKLVKIT
jgi:hypothetical protein